MSASVAGSRQLTMRSREILKKGNEIVRVLGFRISTQETTEQLEPIPKLGISDRQRTIVVYQAANLDVFSLDVTCGLFTTTKSEECL